jgi:hypothetical protein
LLDGVLETRTTSIQQCWRGGFLQACFVIEPLASSGQYLEAGSHNAVPKALWFSCGGLSTSNHPTALASKVAWITGESQISRPESLISRPEPNLPVILVNIDHPSYLQNDCNVCNTDHCKSLSLQPTAV